MASSSETPATVCCRFCDPRNLTRSRFFVHRCLFSGESGVAASAWSVLSQSRGEAMAEQSQLDVLEGRVEELSRHWDRLFADIGQLDTKIDALGVVQSARIAELERKFDGRFEGIDRRFDTLERKFDGRFGGI